MGIWNAWGEQHGMQFEKGGGICRYNGSSNLGVCKSEAQRNVLVRLSTKTIWVVLPLWRGNRWREFNKVSILKNDLSINYNLKVSLIVPCTLLIFLNYYELWLLRMLICHIALEFFNSFIKMWTASCNPSFFLNVYKPLQWYLSLCMKHSSGQLQIKCWVLVKNNPSL